MSEEEIRKLEKGIEDKEKEREAARKAGDLGRAAILGAEIGQIKEQIKALRASAQRPAEPKPAPPLVVEAPVSEPPPEPKAVPEREAEAAPVAPLRPVVAPPLEIESKEESRRNILRRARQALDDGNYIGAIHDLESARKTYDDKEVKSLLDEARRQLQQYKAQELARLQEVIEEDPAAAREIAVQVLKRDPGDTTFSAYLVQAVTRIIEAEDERDIEELVVRAKALMEEPEVESRYEAVRLLDQAISRAEDTEIRKLRDEAERKRTELLKDLGRVTTLVAAEEYGEALEEVTRLKAQNFKTIRIGDLERDLIVYEDDLKAKIASFSAGKATEYIARARQSLEDGYPDTALRTLQQALRLLLLPESNKKQIEEFQQTWVEPAIEKRRQAEERVEAAMRFMGRGEYSKALDALLEVKRTDPNLPRLEKDIQDARAGLAREVAVKMDRERGEALAALQRDDFGSALAGVKRAFDLAKGLEDALEVAQKLRMVQELQEEIARAQKEERQITEIVALAEQRLKEKDFGGAESALEQLEAWGDDWRVREVRSRVSKSWGDAKIYEKACSAFKLGHYQTVRDLCEPIKERHKEANRLWERAEAAIAYRQGREALEDMRVDEAASLLQRVVTLDGDEKAEVNELLLSKVKTLQDKDQAIRAQFNEAKQWRQTGNLEEAYKKLKELRSKPSSLAQKIGQEWEEVCRAWEEQLEEIVRRKKEANLAEAWESARLLRNELGVDSELTRQVGISYYRARAEDLIGAGDPDGALEELEKAVSLAPLDINVRLEMARIHIGIGETKRKANQYSEARKHYGQARQHCGHILDARPNHERAQELLTEIEVQEHLLRAQETLAEAWRSGEFGPTQEELDKARKMAPHNTELRTLYQELTETKRRYEQLRNSLREIKGAFRSEEWEWDVVEKRVQQLRDETADWQGFDPDFHVTLIDPITDQTLSGLTDILRQVNAKRGNLALWKAWFESVQARLAETEAWWEKAERLQRMKLKPEEEYYRRHYRKKGSAEEARPEASSTEEDSPGIWEEAVENYQKCIDSWHEAGKILLALPRDKGGEPFPLLTIAAQKIKADAGERVKELEAARKEAAARIEACKEDRRKFKEAKKRARAHINASQYAAAQESVRHALDLCPYDEVVLYWHELCQEELGRKRRGLLGRFLKRE